MQIKDTNTEEKILLAAKSIFHQKGLGGARMQEIAELAGINKAMLHYYFRSKELLYERVFTDAIQILMPAIAEILNSDASIEGKIYAFAERYITTVQSNPHIPLFVLNELQNNPDKIRKIVSQSGIINMSKLEIQLKEEIEAGRIKQIELLDLFVNLFAMCVFPFVAKPMMQTFFSLDENRYNEFISERKLSVPKFIMLAIQK